MNKPARTNNSSATKGKKTSSVESSIAVAELRQEFHGPLPHPSIFEGYERVLPGSAERILANMENQSKHRQNLESLAIKSGSRDSLLGLIFAFTLGVLTTGSGTLIILKGYTYPGSFFGFMGMGSLLTAFIYGTKSNRKEREAKYQEVK